MFNLHPSSVTILYKFCVDYQEEEKYLSFTLTELWQPQRNKKTSLTAVRKVT